MNSTTITIKTDVTMKAKAQSVAQELGLSLNTLVNDWIRQFSKTKRVTFTGRDEIPNARTRAILKQAEKNWEEGNTSPAFDNIKDNLAWLKKQGI